MSQIGNVLARIDQDIDKSTDRLFDLLKIKSISTDPAYKDDCRNAANWLAAELTEIGIVSSVRDTAGHPMVVGHSAVEPSKPGPHVLFYGHYDVQPVDPLDLWHTDPFEPRIVTKDDGSKIIVARGAADDKGQLLTFVEAARAWIAETGDLPLNVSVIFEGEEESGSPSLDAFVEANQEELSCDLALICDTGMWDAETPAITIMMRGLMGEQIDITAADRDLHSGHYGGAARNPIHLLSSLLAGLHDENGKVTLPGFYDGVPELPDAIASMWDGLGFTTEGFLGPIGLHSPAGEADRTALQQIWSRPTLEVNGIWGGYTGAGFKTVIPSKASAKVSCRLVGDQDPEKIRNALRTYIRENLPADCSVDFHKHGSSGSTHVDYTNPALAHAKDALTEEWGRETALIGAGGSIPIVGDFKQRLGMDTLLIGFGLEDDQIHSPNEKYNFSSFHKGIRSWARILDALATA